LFKEKANQQLKKLLMTNLLLCLRRINSKNWLYLSVKRILLLFILINLRNPAICFSSAAFCKAKRACWSLYFNKIVSPSKAFHFYLG
jgi:hypothetical protein